MAFNQANMLEKVLCDWCDEMSPDNFSGFVKMVLFAYKNGIKAPTVSAAVGALTDQWKPDNDNAMGDVL